MIKKDSERLDRIFQKFSEGGLDYVIGYGDVLIKYFSGGFIDYSMVCIDVSNEMVIGFINIMEARRATESTWLDNIIVFGGQVEDYENVDAKNPIEAFKKYIGEKKVRIGLPYQNISHEEYEKIHELFKNAVIIDVSDILWLLRMRKSRYEQGILSKSGELVDYGIYTSIKNVKEGVTERELANKGRCSMYEYGADKVYDFLIVASGINSANPHWRASERTIKSGDIITFDYVASYDGYYGDETRTIFYKSMSGKKLKEIYEVVLESQVSAIDVIEPGVKVSEVDARARKIIEDAGYGKYFIHSTGHGVGLEVHEKPRLSKNDESILDEGFVVTVEPGIYIPSLGGIRIEDMVLVTSRGHKLLTKLNKALQVIE